MPPLDKIRVSFKPEKIYIQGPPRMWLDHPEGGKNHNEDYKK